MTKLPELTVPDRGRPELRRALCRSKSLRAEAGEDMIERIADWLAVVTWLWETWGETAVRLARSWWDYVAARVGGESNMAWAVEGEERTVPFRRRREWRRKPQDGGTHGSGNFSKSLEAVKSYVRFCGRAGCGVGLEKTCEVGSTWCGHENVVPRVKREMPCWQKIVIEISLSLLPYQQGEEGRPSASDAYYWTL